VNATYFDPGDNLIGAPLWLWIAVGVVWLGPFVAFGCYGALLDRRNKRAGVPFEIPDRLKVEPESPKRSVIQRPEDTQAAYERLVRQLDEIGSASPPAKE
jgi:hypothetical protein